MFATVLWPLWGCGNPLEMLNFHLKWETLLSPLQSPRCGVNSRCICCAFNRRMENGVTCWRSPLGHIPGLVSPRLLTGDKIHLQTKHSSLEVFRFLCLEGSYLPGRILAGVFSFVHSWLSKAAHPKRISPATYLCVCAHIDVCTHFSGFSPF
jgi:hypothetical protein